jgi:hypothetical protein
VQYEEEEDDCCEWCGCNPCECDDDFDDDEMGIDPEEEECRN